MERLIRGLTALLLGSLMTAVYADRAGSADQAAAGTGPADIELRKSFRPTRRAGSGASRSIAPSPPGSDQAATDDPQAVDPGQLQSLAAVLNEPLQSSGTLHLPGVGEKGIVLQVAKTPILETAAGRHLIIDRGRTIDPGLASEISRRWPGFFVVQPPAGADLREVIGSTLDAAGYDAVLRSAPLIFGRGITIRVTPDFVVLRSEDDLLVGETRALSVVDPAQSLPPELREFAGEHRVRIMELTPDGAPAGADRTSRPAPAGRVTSVESERATPILEKIAGALGLSTVRGVRLPAAIGAPGARAELGISGGGVAALVFENIDPAVQEPLVSRGYMVIWLNSAADLPEAIAALLRRCGIAAIGPTVEFFRTPPPGAPPRFAVSVPGWLAETGGRRLLITGSPLPPLVRLYLTREGIDIFEYHLRDGR